ncbi:SDR family oxidoreductase [Ancylobacter radicis]|uniref:SDR family oxidoreductase n=1 Tax=Ancylobacter radicis TaxID=2836179 RepID=A0ABS5R8D3_9HYPH|nr:SDR family oxidoreductase [Ancylobacter radicis]MBS9477898.1 SDR family oxidoreductase [Ancylobacter radicis]
MTGKVLVLGATGTIGRPLVKALLAKGAAVKAASRSGGPVEGAEGVAFDFADPATFGPALEGADRLFLMLPTGNTAITELLMPVVEAAVARRVKVVFLSVLGANADESIPYRQVELALERSGVPYVVLRPNWFADNFLNFWKPGIDHAGVIAVPAGEGKSSFIDTRDIADSAAAALTSDRFDGAAYDLTGPEALGYDAAADILAAALGKPVAYQAVDDATFIGILTGAGVPADYAAFLASIFYPVREGWTAVVTGDVERLTGHAPRTLAGWVADNVAALKA